MKTKLVGLAEHDGTTCNEMKVIFCKKNLPFNLFDKIHNQAYILIQDNN